MGSTVGRGEPGVYNTSPLTLSDGQPCALAVDSQGRLILSAAIGGVTTEGTYNTTPPTLSNGQVTSLQVDSNGNLKTTSPANSSADGNPGNSVPLDATGVWNGTAIDRARTIVGADSGNGTGVAAASLVLNNGASTYYKQLSAAGVGDGYGGAGVPTVANLLYNGSSYDRLKGYSGAAQVMSAQGSLVDRSGSVTTGGTQQTLAAVNTSRRYFYFVNLSAGNLYLNFTTNATAGSGSILVLPNASFSMGPNFMSTELISVYGGTTAQAFTAKEG